MIYDAEVPNQYGTLRVTYYEYIDQHCLTYVSRYNDEVTAMIPLGKGVLDDIVATAEELYEDAHGDPNPPDPPMRLRTLTKKKANTEPCTVAPPSAEEIRKMTADMEAAIDYLQTQKLLKAMLEEQS